MSVMIIIVVVAIIMIILMVIVVVVITIFVLLLPGARLELPREGLRPLHQVTQRPALRALHDLVRVLVPMMRVGVGLRW